MFEPVVWSAVDGCEARNIHGFIEVIAAVMVLSSDGCVLASTGSLSVGRVTVAADVVGEFALFGIIGESATGGAGSVCHSDLAWDVEWHVLSLLSGRLWVHCLGDSALSVDVGSTPYGCVDD